MAAYIDPRVAEGLINQSAAATEGQRRAMTVMFCDMKGFTGLSEGVTPQGLVKVMNRYLSTMSEPIRAHRGVIDKYIGDGIMAYWGPPFVDEADAARHACLAAIDMMGSPWKLAQGVARIAWGAYDPDRLRSQHRHRDRGDACRQYRLRIHDELHGHGRYGEPRIKAESSANKVYGTRCLISQATNTCSAEAVEAREIDRRGDNSPLIP